MQNIEAVLLTEQSSRLCVFGHRTQKLLVITSQAMKKTVCRRIQSPARMYSALLLLSLLFAPIAMQPTSAQINGTGTIQGSVADPSGAVVPGATVKIVEMKTNYARETVTSNTGFFSTARPGSRTLCDHSERKVI